MKFGTYNLQFLFDEGVRLHSGKEHVFTKEFVNERFAYFAEKFDELDTDILFLQELGDESALKKVLERTRNKYSYFIATPDKYGVGNAVIYKEGIDCECFSVPTNTSLPVFDEEDEDVLGKRIWSRRDYVRVNTDYDGKPFSLMGVHIKARFMMYKGGSSFPESQESLTQVEAADATIRSEMFRLSQGKRIREEVDEILSPDTHVAVVGDFNTRRDTDLFKLIRGRLKDKEGYLVDMLEHDGIDHVLVSQSLEGSVVEVKRYEELVQESGPEAIGSDHAPIVVTLG
jgi:exonuclease III